MSDHPPEADLAPSTLAGALFQHSSDALLVVDPISERVLDANPAAAALSEFSRDELIRFSLRALVRHEQEWQDWRVNTGPATPVPSNDSFLLRTRRGGWVPVSVTINRIQLPERDPLALCRLRDRREQIESQRRLLRAEAELRRLLGSVSDAVYSGRIEAGRWQLRYVSPRLQVLTGRPLASLLDNPHSREPAVVPEDLPAWRELIGRAEAGQAGELEYRLMRPDGGLVWVREAVVVTPDESGLTVHGTITDVSDRKRADEEAVALGREQARHLDGLARLAGAVAHDFNNLLTGVLGNLNLARLPGASITDCLARVEGAALRAADHCRQLSQFAGKGVSREGAVDLPALARQLAAGLNLSPGQRLSLDLANELPLAAGDESTLGELIGALLSNAAEALEGGRGDVRLAVQLVGQEATGETVLFRYPTTLPEGLRLCVEVSDTGAGLSAEVLERLFEPYFSTRPDRRGLGLAGALGVVRGLGGAIEVAAQAEGGGTTFRVLLPAARSPSTLVAPPDAAPRAAGRTVLLIEDEQSVRDVTSRLLTSLGCEVLAARDGAEALAGLRERPDVRAVLMDWNLPGLSGEDLVREVRQTSPSVPLFLMSGHTQHELAERVAGLGVNGFLQKPFRLTALLELLRPCLEEAAG
jgi:PAS domain S-box-containing protein